MEKLTNGFFTNGNFNLSDDGEIDTNRFVKDRDNLTKFVDKILQKYDDHPSIYYTGNVYRYFRNFKRVNRSEHGRGAKEFNKIQEYKRINCYIPSGKGCFLKFINFNFKKDFNMEYFSNSYNHIKEEQVL